MAERRPEIALASRAADRKRMIKALEDSNDPLYHQYQTAKSRAEVAARMARKGGDYPLLSGGDVNLYSLFVERAMTICQPEGLVGLLVPSGIASDKTAAKFFKGVSTQGRLSALYDFENKKVFFPEVHASFKFSAFIASPSSTPNEAKCAFFLQSVYELEDPERCFTLSAEDFARVNPNTGTAPIFRTRKDAELTKQFYENAPVLVDRSSGEAIKTWPVKYTTVFHMTNDSALFRTKEELGEKEGAWGGKFNRYDSKDGQWLPLYVGRMIWHYDHRASSVVTNEANLHNAALSENTTSEEKQNPDISS